ncbi:coiled-coil domain-containing protein [Ornithinibacillus contaminans]|uniref:hypothetical protein n=1 Tax=Ornithinibacillus contaminans TaxID=694055 RepID=UPI00064D7926|nr:hypothetical protein [Ornithinibacillus contaminans]
MFQDVNNQLIQVKSDRKRKIKLENQLEDYQVERMEMERAVKKLETQLGEEKADVKKLEGISIANFFSTISGTKYEKLDKENKEVLAVQLQLEEAKKNLEDIDSAILEIQSKLEKVINSEKEYQRLVVTKEQLIKTSNSKFAEDLYQLSEQEADLQAYIQELEEAIHAGNSATEALTNAVDSLKDAKNWGTLDMFGGGMLSSAIKHSNMDKASEYIHTAQQRMRSFQKELLDIDERIHIEVDISGLLKFADFFLDGLIVDWMVQGRINDAYEQAYSQLSKVTGIVKRLENQLATDESKLATLQSAKIEIIEQS